MIMSTNENRLFFFFPTVTLLSFELMCSNQGTDIYKETEQDIKLSRRREHNNGNEEHQLIYLSVKGIFSDSNNIF